MDHLEDHAIGALPNDTGWAALQPVFRVLVRPKNRPVRLWIENNVFFQ
jgi:hypothetical protein